MTKKLIRFDQESEQKDGKDYKRYLKELRDIASEQHTKMADAQELIKQGELSERANLVISAFERGNSVENISNFLGISLTEVQQIVEKNTTKSK